MTKTISILLTLSTLVFSCQNNFTKTNIVSEILDKDKPNKYAINYSSDTSFTEFIDGLDRVQEGIILSEDSISGNYSCRINFDQYFEAFDKLHIAKNWNLESHYRHFGDAGRPLLLAFQDGNIFGDSIQSLIQKSIKGKGIESRQDYSVSEKLFDYQDSVNYLDCIKVKDSKMGYFQFATFAFIGDNYCKFWHSNYGERSIITSKEQLKKLTKKRDSFYYKFSSKEDNGIFKNLTMDTETVLQIDPTPQITLDKETAEVRIITLSPWAGFIERKFTISRTFPHKIEQSYIDTLIEYNSGIMF